MNDSQGILWEVFIQSKPGQTHIVTAQLISTTTKTVQVYGKASRSKEETRIKTTE